MSDKVPQSCRTPESVKTINDLAKFESASLVLKGRAEDLSGEGIGWVGDVLPEPIGLGVALLFCIEEGCIVRGCADSPE